MDLASDIVGMGQRVEVDIDDEDDEGNGETDTITVDGQESYLGYLPDEDIFVSGWDMDEDSTFPNIAYIKIDGKGKAKGARAKKQVSGMDSGGGFYYNGTYKKVKKLHKNIIDVRLD